MDRKYVIENDLVDRYVRGQLSPDEEQAFEEFYLTDDWTQQALTEVIGLKRALADNDAESPPTAARVIELPVVSKRPPPTPPSSGNQWAIAAGMFAAAAMAGGAGFWGGRHISDDSADFSPLTNLQRVELIETRGTTRAGSFDLKAGAPLLLEIETGYTGDGPLAAQLRGLPDGGVHAFLGDIRLDQYGRVAAVVPGVDPGTYRLELLEEESGTVVSSYDFEVH